MQARTTPPSKRHRRKARAAGPKPAAGVVQQPRSEGPEEDKLFNEPATPPAPSVVPVEGIVAPKKPDETETCEPPDETATVSSDLS